MSGKNSKNKKISVSIQNWFKKNIVYVLAFIVTIIGILIPIFTKDNIITGIMANKKKYSLFRNSIFYWFI